MLSSVVEHILHTDGVSGSNPLACTTLVPKSERNCIFLLTSFPPLGMMLGGSGFEMGNDSAIRFK